MRTVSGPVDKSRDTGPYLHVYVVTVILPTKTHVEVSFASSAIFDHLYLLLLHIHAGTDMHTRIPRFVQ